MGCESNSRKNAVTNVESKLVTLTAEKLYEMMEGLYEIEAANGKVIYQERKATKQLIMIIVGKDRLTISNVVKQTIKGEKGEGLLYTGYANESKGEKVIVTIKIITDSKVHVITSIDGKENELEGNLIKLM